MGVLRLGQLTFPRNTFMQLARALEAVTKFTIVVSGELPDYLIEAAWHVSSNRWLKPDNLTNVEFVRGHWLLLVV
jgi:hypothetical protein